jgi:AraC family transcriptional regulator of arabinose operon
MKRNRIGMHETLRLQSRSGLPLLTGHYRELLPYHMQYAGGADRLLMFTLAGKGVIIQNGRRLEVAAGDIVIGEPRAYRDYGCAPGILWDFVWVHFMARPNWEEWLDWPTFEPGLRFIHIKQNTVRQQLKQTFFRCHRYANEGLEGLTGELAFTALEEFILIVARELNFSARKNPLSPDIRRVAEHLAANSLKTQAVPELARMAGLSNSRFAARFKAETGETPISYLIKLRLRHGASLLEIGHSSVKEVAAYCGFQSPFYFSRQFKRLFGVSPLFYKERVRPGATP